MGREGQELSGRSVNRPDNDWTGREGRQQLAPGEGTLCPALSIHNPLRFYQEGAVTGNAERSEPKGH